MEYPTVSLLECPTVESWKLPVLYKQGAKNQLVWSIAFHDGHLIIVHGISLTSKGKQGKLQTDRTAVELNQSGRTMQAQAFQEAVDRFRKKYRKEGYRPKEDVSVPETAKGAQGPKPMNAMRWFSSTAKSHCKSAIELRKSRCATYPAVVQYKLDGVRCLIRIDEKGALICRTRENRIYTHLSHLDCSLRNILSKLPPNCELDGELYIHGIRFQQLVSILRPDKNISPRLSEVQYWIFDVIAPGTYTERYDTLVRAYTESPNVKILPCFPVTDDDQVLSKYNEFRGMGYEGAMVKTCSGIYEHRRTDKILKIKAELDEEVEIIGVAEAKGTQLGAAVCLVRDREGREFKCALQGTLEYRRELAQNPEKLVGKRLTISFQERSMEGIPRFPWGVAIRDYE